MKQRIPFEFPLLGERIVKTAVAVFICLFIHYLRNFEGSPTDSVITAIICMQPYISDSKHAALSRVFGTFFGALWGLAFLLLMSAMPGMADRMVIVYLLMSLFVIAGLYSAVVLRQTDGAGLVAITFLCIVIAWPDVQSPLEQTTKSLVDTVIGTLVAISVNHADLLRRKHPERIFFIRMQDIVPDRYATISRHVIYWINRLGHDGAKICLMTRHAPAFLLPQLGSTKVNVPAIVMDGAAAFDINEKTYPLVSSIPKQDAEAMTELLDGFDLSYSIYAIHQRTMFIYNKGDYTGFQEQIYRVMRKSPYRNYIVGHPHSEDQILYFKIIDTPERIAQLQQMIGHHMPKNRFRMVAREHIGFDGISGLYIYNVSASVENMKRRLLQYLERETKLDPVNIQQTHPYRTERDAMQIVRMVRRQYEPPVFIRNKKPPV